MSYIEQNLVAGEKLLYQTNLHWVVFLWPAIFFVGFLGGIIGLASEPAVRVVVGVVFLLLAVITGISSWIKSSSSEFGVTNKRVLIKVGFIRRHSLEILLTKVEGIGVDQDLWGRILGYGSIQVTGTGGTKELFHRIAAPLEFRRRVQEQIAATQETK